jgi:diguanylate cyclase (GGDEF)-like protein
MPKTPIILGKVVSLTEIRDIEIFEFSLMKSLAEMLNVNDISLYKFNNTNKPCRLIKYSSDTEISQGKKRTDESKEIHIENIDIPDSINNAINWIKSTGKTYTTKTDDKFLNIYPVASLNRIIGYLSVTLTHELNESENLVISSLLSISENFHSLLEENQRDKLTGLLNRKTFDDNISKIQELIAFSTHYEKQYSGTEKRHNKTDDEYWLSIIDIDFFKKINDKFGHMYGDEILLMVSQIMNKTFRPNDLLFRFGGEEFVVIVKVSNIEEAKLIFERYRKAIENFAFPQIEKVTISLGATEIKETHIIASDIVGRADKALYYAKDNGRNKLFFYEELLAEGIIEEKVKDGGMVIF